MMKLFRSLLLVIVVVSVCSCRQRRSQFEVEGMVDGLGDTIMLLEACDNGQWYVMDTVNVSEDGTFVQRHDMQPYPGIYRLRLGGRSIYFPIDSTDHVRVVANHDEFDTHYELSGTPSAEMLYKVDSLIASSVRLKGVENTVSDSVLKRRLSGMLLAEPASIVSYYIISKRVAGKPLFDPSNKSALRVIGAVANAFDVYRPDDPRAKYLKTLYLANRRAISSMAVSDTIRAAETKIIDVNLYNEKGKRTSLRDVAVENHTVLLCFTDYDADFSPALNVVLNKFYERLHAKGLEIYQVGLGVNEFRWREAAGNLPWITVYNGPADGASVLQDYVVMELPTVFIIRDGEIVERVDNIAKLDNAISRVM